MNFVDFIIIGCIIGGALLGFKKGVIKTLVQLLGTITVLILSYTFKDILANYLMRYLPFFNFAGFEGISAMNILIYELLSFIAIFVIAYCVLNILVTLSGLIEKILKITIVLAIPSKILGAILGAIEGLVFAFVVVFILFHAGITSHFVYESKSGVVLLERTPFIGQVMASSTLALEDVNNLISKYDGERTEIENRELNAQVISLLIHYNVVSKDTIADLVEADKLDLDNVQFN
ncbi:MAG: CvpA family protein [Firmicutes bacterium]|nr:CvpA family protein [Bacillota bacterium]